MRKIFINNIWKQEGIYTLLIVCIISSICYSQGTFGPVRLQGSLNLSGEFYGVSGILDRRPASTNRAILTPTLIIFDQIQLPFEIYIGSEGRGYLQPFNQFGVSPRLFGWLTLHAGYFSTRLSNLTFGDTRLLGTGIEMNPGIFRFSFIYGRSKRAIGPDSINNVLGTYSRKIIAVQLGLGSMASAYFNLNFLHAIDDSNSIKNAPPSIMPEENAVTSLQFGLPVYTHIISITGEVGISALSNNIRERALKGTSALNWLFTPRNSTQVDGAAMMSMNIIPASVFSMSLTGKWIGPGFVTLGYAQLPNDVLDVTIGPSFRLLQNKLLINGTFGKRYNNLRNNHLSTTQRTIGNLNITSQPVQNFGFNINYANYGMKSSNISDTLRIDNTTQSITITPHLNFNSLGGINTIVLTYSNNNFSDYNVLTSAASQNKTQAVVVMWSLALPISLALSTALNYTSSIALYHDVIIRSIIQSVGYPFFNNKVSTNLSLGYNIVSASSTDGQFTSRLSISYTFTGTISLNLMSNAYNYGNNESPSYKEFQASLQYNISF